VRRSTYVKRRFSKLFVLRPYVPRDIAWTIHHRTIDEQTPLGGRYDRAAFRTKWG
jgi:hypothetical protein